MRHGCAPFCALLKVVVDPYVGKLTYFRFIPAGSRSTLINSGRTAASGSPSFEKHANHREEIQEARPVIVAAVG